MFSASFSIFLIASCSFFFSAFPAPANLFAPWFELSEDAVSVKAKTHERCDAVGEGKAVAAQVVVLLTGIAD